MTKYFVVAATAVVLLFAAHAGLPQEMSPVFDGTSLAGWHTVGGAQWRVENGAIVGTVHNGAEGWLVMDSVYGPAELTASFECNHCQPSVLVRSEKTGDTTSGFNLALSGKDVGSVSRVTLDGQGKIVSSTALPVFGGEAANVAVPPNFLITGSCLPIPCPGITDAHGGGVGTPGIVGQQSKAALLASGVNELHVTMSDEIVNGSLNHVALPGAAMDTTHHPYGQIALHIAGPDGAEIRITHIALQNNTVRAAGLASEVTSPNYRKQLLTDLFYAEGTGVGDINHSGHQDIVAGPFWYEGPDFKNAHEIYPPAPIDVAGSPEYPGGPPVPQYGSITHGSYPPSFMSWVYDFNHDGYPDILSIMSFGPRPTFQAQLFVNPKGQNRHWTNYQVVPLITNESNQFVDLFHNGKRVLTGMVATRGDWSDAQVGYWQPDDSDVTKPWKFVAISEKGLWSGHGMGEGDILGNGRLDVVTPTGWWEQPANPTPGVLWKYHPARLGNGGADLYVYDVNGDGLMDVVTSLWGHGPGLSWFEQQKDAQGNITWKEHLIMGDPTTPMADRTSWGETDKSVAFTELHSMSFVDMDGDGLPDIITGKRWYSHGYHYDMENDITDPPVIYIFHLKRTADHQVQWVPEMVTNAYDDAIRLTVSDVNGDGKPDIVSAGRKGTVIFYNQGGGAQVSQTSAPAQ
jgi:hypothetical protein